MSLSPETVYQYINGSARFAGFDLSLTSRFLDQWQASGSLSYLWGKDTELNEPALGVSPLTGTLGLRYDFRNEPLFLESSLQFAGPQGRVSSARGETSSDGYPVIDLQSGWSISRLISFQFGVKNLLNSQYINHLNAKNPYTSAPITELGIVIFGDLSIAF